VKLPVSVIAMKVRNWSISSIAVIGGGPDRPVFEAGGLYHYSLSVRLKTFVSLINPRSAI
jgi:hypothetical protein